jgi:carboxymethylenebutenolidase
MNSPAPPPPAVSQQALLDAFQRHLTAELTGDLAAALATMTADPHVTHVPVLTGGVGRAGVRRFYRDHLVGKLFPPDAELTTVSLTVGADRLVEEAVVRFTHTAPVDWMLPGVPPTGKRVEAAAVVVVGFEGDKIASERIYWDQASALVQLGLLDPAGLPVCGAESARKVLDPTLPVRALDGAGPRGRRRPAARARRRGTRARPRPARPRRWRRPAPGP